ncbi:MAG: hypothetical protein PVI90_09150 [Desulfobacteraceae bacterium]|jgi:hypothetical protein
MGGKIISIEVDDGPFKPVFTRVMKMVPDRDKKDKSLQRLIAFRLKNDGEEVTRQYLISKIKDMIQCAYSGRLYDFIKNDEKLSDCKSAQNEPDPPEIA